MRRVSGWRLGLVFGTLGVGIARADAQISPPCMVRTPDIHGDKIVFSAEGDLWLGSLSAGTAARITTHEGVEDRPRFSPDGKRLAFTGSYDGGREVYVMPVEGGEPKRLTYDPYGAELVGWTPDGKQILFRSSRSVPMTGQRLYLVSAEGGLPQPLPMERATQGAFAPDGKRLAYCRLNLEDHHWKRYRGGEANRIWIANLDKKTFTRINNDTINEQYPVWVGDTIYYVSEKDGTANLWRYDTRSGHTARITSHDTYDVVAPSSDGQRLIYQWGNSLWTVDLKTGKDQEVRLALATDHLHARVHTVDGSPGAFALGPTGKRLIAESRGQLATLPAEKGEVRPLATVLGTRSKQPAWSPDGKWIAFLSDRSGEDNLWIAPASGEGDPRQITNEARIHLENPVWAADSKKIAFTDNTLALWIVDIETKAKTEVARGEYGGIGSYHFSPDGKWLVYARPENFFVQSLYLYNVAQKQSTRLTFPPTRDSDAAFDPSGKYLYFLSERNVKADGDSFDFQSDFDHTTKIYLLSLAADTPSPLSEESDEEPGAATDSKPASPALSSKPAEGDKSAPKPESAPKLPEVKVDLEGIAQRMMELPIAPGRYSSLSALPGNKIVYMTREEDGATKLKLYDFGAKKETELGANVQNYALSADGKKLAAQTGSGIQIVDAGAVIAPGAGRVDTRGWRVTVAPVKEWRQVFEEAWRAHRDTFYDPNLHGMDWEGVRRKYEALLPSVGVRSDLNFLIGEMQGEMNVSHEFVGGGYSRRTAPPSPGFGALGADLAYDATNHAYRFTNIFAGDGFESSARSPLLVPGLNVKAGDYLLAINGTPLKADQDPAALLIGTGGKVVTLRVNSKPTTDGSRLLRIKAMSNDSQARYYDWVQRCRDYVTKNGGPNLAYIHVPDMGGFGIAEFTKHFYANLDKDGIVLDVRYNGGGIISGQILQRLSRVIFEYDQPRYGRPQPYVYNAFPGRVVVLCNERTGSDGEYFCTGFRAMKLGPTVGTRTWGGFMSVSGFGTLDGGFVSVPQLGSFTPEGKWLPDGYGFNPDFTVEENANAFVAGRDPQLDKAIELLKEEIKRNPPHRMDRQPTPSKEKAFLPNKK